MGKGSSSGFTLIEIGIVLVIVGLVTGSVLVGQNLIRAAELRSTISQIEKFQTAVNTFRGKYGALPGDMNAATAMQFGFSPRGGLPGQGDGNGVLEGTYDDSGTSNYGSIQGSGGENSVFWVDLTTANGLNVNLIEGSFAAGFAGCCLTYVVTATSTPQNLKNFLPEVKLGRGNLIYVYSFGRINYFGIAMVQWIAGGAMGWPSMASSAGLTVEEAYGMDRKMDDGYPQTGRVTAQYDTGYLYNDNPAPWIGASDTSATSASPATCYDNGNTTGALQQYSMSQNGGAGVNCVVSIQFQ